MEISSRQLKSDSTLHLQSSENAILSVTTDVQAIAT